MAYSYKAIRVNGKKVDYHRYLMEQHLGRKLSPDEVVHHINGDKRDNRIENLRVDLRSDHSRSHMAGRKLSDQTRQRMSDSKRGRPAASRKLTAQQVTQIRARLLQGESLRSIAKSYGVSHCTILGIRNGQYYRDVA